MGAAMSSEFEVEPVQGRKVSKVVKTTVVRGERTEKQTGDRSLAADLPSAREDFEKVSVPNSAVPARSERPAQLIPLPPHPLAPLPLQALSYAGGFGKVSVPHVVEKEVVQDDGSVVKRLENVREPR